MQRASFYDVCCGLQAKEFGEAEVWMNERLMRAAPGCFAEFLTAFEAEEKTSKGKAPEPLWLVWQYEGDYTLFDLMQKKDFPYNMEPLLLGQELDMPKGPQRKAVTISIIMQQVCRAGTGASRLCGCANVSSPVLPLPCK